MMPSVAQSMALTGVTYQIINWKQYEMKQFSTYFI